MLKQLEGLKSYKVFKYFKEMNEIPRGSGNEKGVSDWLVKFARERELDVYQDEALNVIIRKSGTEGYENSETVVLQGHMDMVCEKNVGTEHDFMKDEIKFIVDGDVLRADGTTLGADNGIAVAYGLAVLDSNDIAHPPIELLLTTEEETGMGGALALDETQIKGKMLINIDSEEEGTLLVSCAGGVRQIIEVVVDKDDISEDESVISIKIRGLKGGHSGMDINKERGNSNKLMGRILNELRMKADIKICEINGGSKMNAIPRECDCSLVYLKNQKEIVSGIVEDFNNIFKRELEASDESVSVTCEEVVRTNSFTKEDSDRIISLLTLIPNGPQSMSMQIEGLVESSTNIGVCTTDNNRVTFESAIRSSVESRKWEIAKRGDMIAEVLDGKIEYQSAYPAWQYKSNSKLRDCMSDVYENIAGVKPQVSAIHAGLECGLFGGKFGDEMDMVSFGPNLHDVHTPNEWAEISSVDRCWEYLKEVLKNLK